MAACLITAGIYAGSTTAALGHLSLVAISLGVVGALEDFRGVRPSRRFIAQLTIVTIAAVVVLDRVLDVGRPGLIGLVGIVLWLVSYVNVFNFMDGINGISAAQTISAGVGLALMGDHIGSDHVAVGGSLVAGAALGFAPFNVPKARVFLGDAGSYFFGGWLALLSAVAFASGVPLHTVASPFLIYLADAGTTLTRRMLRGEAWSQPHRMHVYQRLTQMGWSHTLTTSIVLGAITVCIVLGIATIDASPAGAIAAIGGMALPVGLYLASPTLLSWFRMRRAMRS